MLRTIHRTAAATLLAAGAATFLAAPTPAGEVNPGGVRVDAPGPGYGPDGFLSPDGGVTLADEDGGPGGGR
ncbi:hypothetical protein J4H86_24020 [Spiractinospora alimapuensis]|uniref:hypothetical protein n=1 Tax=Spiractinospora alimapuensis TaxID=2820884 RepID=UPI001F1E26F5|nr:hypothetical protein [Spiractinospora alimapuensis]QVQ51797.1 hypothetical protein J4H86_24020 [Spiractinospora alimapuensis]